jgi:hypothetical protein
MGLTVPRYAYKKFDSSDLKAKALKDKTRGSIWRHV